LKLKGNKTNGVNHGIWEMYEENGEVRHRVCYKNGDKVIYDLIFCET
jgi:antitoxin component YwqK of YwqJK toxin-antitoxin module